MKSCRLDRLEEAILNQLSHQLPTSRPKLSKEKLFRDIERLKREKVAHFQDYKDDIIAREVYLSKKEAIDQQVRDLDEGLVILMIFMVMFLSGLINGLERIVSSAIETMDAAYFLVDEDAEGNIPYSMLTDEQVADVEKAKLGDLAELNILRSTFTAKGIKDKQTAAILVTHDERILDVVDRIYRLQKGKLVEEAPYQ